MQNTLTKSYPTARTLIRERFNCFNYFLRLSGFPNSYRKVFQINLVFSYNLVRNIYILFHVLAQFLFTTSETELGYYPQNVDVWAAERITTWDLLKLGNLKKVLEMFGFDSTQPVTQKPNCETFQRKTYFVYFCVSKVNMTGLGRCLNGCSF